MDSLITAGARALASGDALGALNYIALRDDAAALYSGRMPIVWRDWIMVRMTRPLAVTHRPFCWSPRR